MQIRSLTMDLWASMEHRIIYKSPNVDIERSRKVFLKFANELKECENQLFDLKKKIINVMGLLYNIGRREGIIDMKHIICGSFHEIKWICGY